MNRRKLLKWGIGLGALTALGTTARYLFLPPSRSEHLGTVDELAVQLMPFLDALPEETGRKRVLNQWFINWSGIHFMRLLVCGDPRKPPYQIVLSGPHLNLRLGGRSAEGAAFGGPQIYGDQRGNGEVGLPGNLYRYQMEAAHRLRAAMTNAQREAARVAQAPAQTLIDVQGRDGRFDGVPVAELSADNRALAARIVEGLLENYPAADAAYYQPGAVVGRLRPGPIRTGDIYCAESWQDSLAVVEVKGADLAPGRAEQLRARGVVPQAGSTYRIATTGFVADEEASGKLGRVTSRSRVGLVRDAIIGHARARGFDTGV